MFFDNDIVAFDLEINNKASRERDWLMLIKAKLELIFSLFRSFSFLCNNHQFLFFVKVQFFLVILLVLDDVDQGETRTDFLYLFF